jgi:hypothetical protein
MPIADRKAIYIRVKDRQTGNYVFKRKGTYWRYRDTIEFGLHAPNHSVYTKAKGDGN